MTAIVLNQVQKGLYLDSVALMRMSRTIASMEGVEEAALMMGTASNREIMAEAGLLVEAGAAASGGDLIIGVRAATKNRRAKPRLPKPLRNWSSPRLSATLTKCGARRVYRRL